MKKQTLEEWRTEATELFGPDPVNWKFVCPACGRVNTGREFKDFGADPNEMYQSCIGRVNGKMNPPTEEVKAAGEGCNWAAFGLFGTLDKGRIVIADDGDEVEVFDFATETPSESHE
jgi:hypothetical protein